MRYVEVDGKRASVLGFGCGGVLGRVGRRESLRAMGAAWDAGVTLFDTARSYGYGEAEGLLGEFLRGRQELAVVVTKFGIWPEPMPGWKRRARPLVRAVLGAVPKARGLVRRVGVSGTSSAGRFDAHTMRRSLEESLRQLRMESVDMLLVHEASGEALRDEELSAALEAAVREGKVRRVGVSVGAVIAEAAGGRWPTWVGALQLPVSSPAIAAEGERRPAGGRFVMGNHPFGGADRARRWTREIGAMARDAAVESALREKLAGEPRETLARVLFGAAFAGGADAVVPSMLHEGTVRANAAAVESGAFSEEELRTVRARLGAEAAGFSAPREGEAVP